jgi:Fe2+ transport system protein FeoA
MMVPLELLASGEWAEVAEVGGEPAWVARLAEMGLRHGARVQMLQPGRTCLVCIDGKCRLSLRSESAEHILVCPVSVPSARPVEV